MMMLNGSEIWSLLDKHHNALSVFQMRCLMQVCSMLMRDHITNQDVLKSRASFVIDIQPGLKRLGWLDDVCRAPDSKL